MTIPNQITVVRLLLIPVFVMLAVYYGQSVQQGAPQAALRWWAVAAFGIASISDGLDGYLARRLNQRSRLGVILDPIADKGLLLAGILTLGLSHWPNGLPPWFLILVIARDIGLLVGATVLHLLNGSVQVRPSAWGKCATALQMTTLVAVMLGLDDFTAPLRLTPSLIWLAGGFTLASSIGYIIQGLGQLHASGQGDPAQHDQQATSIETKGS